MIVTNEQQEQQREEVALRVVPRLLVDARKITDGGIGRYTASLLEALGSQHIQVTALVNGSQRSLLPGFVTPLITHHKPFSIGSFLMLGSEIPWGLFDLYHSPHFLVPRNVPIPTVVTVHDAIPISHPSGILHQRITSFLLARLAKTASQIVTVSRSSAQQLRDLVGLNTLVVPNILPFEEIESDKALVVDNERYVVGVFSNDKPHKGQMNFALACQRCGVRGVAIGRGAASLKNQPSVTCMDELPWHKLLEIYRGATALVVASSVEGFCLPAMEAKALGVRVVSTPEPAVLELLDGNDEVAADFSSDGLSEALRRALSRPVNDYRWQRASEYYPECVASQMMEIYNKVLGRA